MVYPSIFNDVIGPVMRGPSSSHCAAALRIGLLCRDLMAGCVKNVHIEYDPKGSLATTHASQGSDMGLFGGLLGWQADDARLPDYKKAIHQSGINISIAIKPLQNPHPNTYSIHLSNETEQHQFVAVSTGGGMIEVIEIDGATVGIAGDYYETLIYSADVDAIMNLLCNEIAVDELNVCRKSKTYIHIRAQEFLSEKIKSDLQQLNKTILIRELSPVLPTGGRKHISVPFINCEQMLQYNADKQLSLWELAVHYESVRGNISHHDVFKRMAAIIAIMESCVTEGLKGTSYDDRILGSQAPAFKKKMEQQNLIGGDALNLMIMMITAIMEVKSSMGVIVAAPTAGSCGALPGAVLAISRFLECGAEEKVKAMLAAGLIGVFISHDATFAAEVGGCQAECGAGAGMAAAAITYLAGGSLQQSLSAASMALQNSFGMTCDPIGNRVEAPCLGKNVMAGSNALSCANMALANYEHLIPLDEVIKAMDKVGKSLHYGLRCTGLGGLAVTKTAKAIEEKLKGVSESEARLDNINIIQFKSC